MSLVRINKLLAERFRCSRREADQLIRLGRVKVFGGGPETRQGVGKSIPKGTKPPLPAAPEIPAVLGALVPRTCRVRLLPAPLPGRAEAAAEGRGEMGGTPHAAPIGPGSKGERTTILLHKPLGVVSCQPEPAGAGRRQYVPAIRLCTADREHKKPAGGGSGAGGATGPGGRARPPAPPPQAQRGWRVAGRLDANSTGLLVLTRSGRVASEVLGNTPPAEAGGGGGRRLEKEYLVRVPQLATDPPGVVEEKLGELSRGVRCGEDELTAVRVGRVNPDQVRFVLDRGRRHHVRRMCRGVGWDAAALKRVRIGRVRLGDLPVGCWRYLRPGESFA